MIPTGDPPPVMDDELPNTSEVLLELEEFHVRPIRLLKPRDKRLSVLSYSSKRMLLASMDLLRVVPLISTEKELKDQRRQLVLSFDSRRLSHLLSTKLDEFHCRPMRLSSRPSKLLKLVLPPLGLRVTTPTRSSFPTVLSPPVEEKRKLIEIRNLPISAAPAAAPAPVDDSDMVFAVALVDFHHQRGPEVQWWRLNYHPEYTPLLFKNLPFQALPDGSHLFEETFSNFNLVYDFSTGESIDDMTELNKFQNDPRHLKTLFGCSCVCQVKLLELPDVEKQNSEITRLMVQKAVVVIVRKQPVFTRIKEKLSIITKAFFMQLSFDNFQVLDDLFDNLNLSFKMDDEPKEKQEEEFFVNLDLRANLMKFKHRFLVIYKALLMEKKVVIYSNSNLELLTLFQNNLISLIPNLINHLDESGCPLIDYTETNGPLEKPTSLNTTNRKLMLRFFGLPLQIFNTKESFWNPYLPLQQLEELKTPSYMVGCSNLLIVNQAPAFGVDVVVNLDTNDIQYPSGKTEEYSLSHDDKKFINSLVDQIDRASLDDMYVGNDDYIRYHFEDYLVSLIATMRYHQYQEKFNQPPPGFDQLTSDTSIGNIDRFNGAWVEKWRQTKNFRIWNATADEFIFNFSEPKHIATDMADVGGAYRNISNFFAGWKSETKDVREPYQLLEAQKFIKEQEEEVKLEATELTQLEAVTVEEDNLVGKLILSWTSTYWGKKS